MKVIIFSDKQNFDGSLNLINKKLKKKEKRFWNYEKYIPFLFEKIKSLDKLKDGDLRLIKTFFYTGKYNSKLINKFKWNCNKKINELNRLIINEQDLLDFISKQDIENNVKIKIKNHVKLFKEEFEQRKTEFKNKIEKQKRNFNGQKEFFEKINKNSLIEVRTTPLKQGDGEIYQKGVDVKIATDIINLAHSGAYDIALILGGDTDLIECIRLVKEKGKIIIVVAFYTPGDPLSSTISDLIKIADHFINLNNLTKEEINKMSDLLN